MKSLNRYENDPTNDDETDRFDLGADESDLQDSFLSHQRSLAGGSQPVEIPEANPELQRADHLLSDTETPGYQLLDVPLSGAMGAVYRAYNESLQRIVALKFSTICDGKFDSEQKELQLRTEATNLARIEYAKIARCYGYGEFAGKFWVEMQWIDGVTFGDLIEFVHAQNSSHRIDDSWLSDWMLELVDALNFCKHRGVHHLDLKPGNLMLRFKSAHISSADSADDLGSVTNAILNCDFEAVSKEEFRSWCRQQEICVLDFGLAKRETTDREITTMNGSPLWKAPEQVCGVPTDPSLIDQYGIGGILYACLTGRSPNKPDVSLFRRAVADRDATVFCSRADPKALNTHANRDLAAIAMKCLQSDPSDRYGNFDELRSDLIKSQSLQPIEARSLPLPERFSRYVQRERWSVGIIAGLTMALFIVLFLFTSWLQADREAALARKNQNQMFADAMYALGFVGQLYRVDPQLNQPQNRDLAIQFSENMFELYQPFRDREGLSAEDRKLLAVRSEQMALEQTKRGDYRLAAKFYNETVLQYRQILDDENPTEKDELAWCMASVNLLRAEASVSRELYPAAEILTRSEEVIAKTRKLASNELLLYVLSNHCRLKLILQGRAGARDCQDRLFESYALLKQLWQPQDDHIILRARSLYNLGRVQYKGGLNKSAHTELFSDSIRLYRDLIQNGVRTSEMTIEYAYAIATLTMSKAAQLKNLTNEIVDQQQRSDALKPLIDEIENRYKYSLAILETQSQTDPLNNQLLQARINIQWMIADFFRVKSTFDSETQIAQEIATREACISLIHEMVERQPHSEETKHDLSLNLFRQLAAWGRLGNHEMESEYLRQLMAVKDWRKLESFETCDKTSLAFHLIDTAVTANHRSDICPTELNEILLQTIDALESFQQATNRLFSARHADFSREWPEDEIARIAISFPECQHNVRAFLGLLDMQGVRQSGRQFAEHSSLTRIDSNKNSPIVDVPFNHQND